MRNISILFNLLKLFLANIYSYLHLSASLGLLAHSCLYLNNNITDAVAQLYFLMAFGLALISTFCFIQGINEPTKEDSNEDYNGYL